MKRFRDFLNSTDEDLERNFQNEKEIKRLQIAALYNKTEPSETANYRLLEKIYDKELMIKCGDLNSLIKIKSKIEKESLDVFDFTYDEMELKDFSLIVDNSELFCNIDELFESNDNLDIFCSVENVKFLLNHKFYLDWEKLDNFEEIILCHAYITLNEDLIIFLKSRNIEINRNWIMEKNDADMIELIMKYDSTFFESQKVNFVLQAIKTDNLHLIVYLFENCEINPKFFNINDLIITENKLIENYFNILWGKLKIQWKISQNIYCSIDHENLSENELFYYCPNNHATRFLLTRNYSCPLCREKINIDIVYRLKIDTEKSVSN